MEYELVKQLEEAGFPYKRDKFYPECQPLEQIYPKARIPTLSELIEACGNDFFQLTKGSDIWYAEGDIIGIEKVTGSTPKEAVAKLWLKLNK